MKTLWKKFGTAITALSLVLSFSCGPDRAKLLIEAGQPSMPILAKKDRNRALHMKLLSSDTLADRQLQAFEFSLEGSSELGDIAKAEVYYNKADDFEGSSLFGGTSDITATFVI